MKKTILTYGTFDLFHVGHVRLLKRLKNLGTKLIVGVSTDKFNEIKGKKTAIPFKERKEILEACQYVDEVIEENNWEQKKNDIKKYDIDVFAMGDDWKGKFNFLNNICKVVYLPRTAGVSTTQLKKHVLQNFK